MRYTTARVCAVATIGVVLFVNPAGVFGIQVGVNIDVHQDIPPGGPLPNDFHIEGSIESGQPGQGWANPPVLLDHVDEMFPQFTHDIQPDTTKPGENWYNFTADWSFPQGDEGIPFCTTLHLGLLFDVTCHNVVIELVGWWTRDGQPIDMGFNDGFVPILGFDVQDRRADQFIHIQNGDMDPAGGPGEIEVQVVAMDLVSLPDEEALMGLLGPEPFRELREGGLQGGLPWVPVWQGSEAISETNPVFVPPDSFFDVRLEGDDGIFPRTPVPVPPGGFLIARERMMFINNAQQIDFRWEWEIHEAHSADLGDAPDSSNSWGMGMTAYAAAVPAMFPTVYQMGSPPYGPIHWRPRDAAYLGQWVTLEDEADLLPDEDPTTNIIPPNNLADLDMADNGVIGIPLALPHCQPTTFDFTVTTVNPVDPMYVNVFFDWNRNGTWNDAENCPVGLADEWAVQNMTLVGLLPSSFYTFTTPQFLPWHPTDPPREIWMRVTLSDRPYQAGGFSDAGGDGPVEGYMFGETEDFIFVPGDEPQTEACCLDDGECRDLTRSECVALGGTPQGPGTACSGTTEGCCLPDGECVDVDPICCDDLGGTPQGAGTGCVDTTIACCLPDGSCLDVDPLCCDDLGGTEGYVDTCQGDADGNGIDDACEFAQVIMACCLPDGDCVDTDHMDCVSRGGDPQGPGTSCDSLTMECVPLKWAQPPLLTDDTPFLDCFWGWDEFSVYGGQQIVADDWLCEDDRPVTDVHWWGSYIGWNEQEPPANAPDGFHIGIWTDVPTNGVPFSHPGVMLRDWTVARSELNERPVGCDFHPDVIGPDTCFRYDFRIPENEWFQQEPGPTVYWVSISAVYLFAPPTDPIWGWKTREHFFNDDAVRILFPTAPTPGEEYEFGEPVRPGWDMSFVLTTTEEPPELVPKWIQKPHPPGLGFDAASDLWLHADPPPKWLQLPEPELPGLHAHDWVGTAGGHRWITLADDWVCDGGDVLKFEWWGNYEEDMFGVEKRGSGIDKFHLSIHLCMPGGPWCVPMDPEIWGLDVTFASVTEVWTGLFNNEGSRIYLYEFTLPNPFPQMLGQHYWLDIHAWANDPNDPAIWRWQEARRDVAPPLGLAPAAERASDDAGPGPWRSIVWGSDPERYSDLAFAVTSEVDEPPIEVNKVVADDFISDGRPIERVRWWGSYLDERYKPDGATDLFHVLDGWIISFHHADPEGGYDACPPDLLAGDPHPTVLGLYFAPVDAVQIQSMGYDDCFDHEVFEYVVDLSRCCLICWEADPRSGLVPAQPHAFKEEYRFKYWLDIQAVTGAVWLDNPLGTPNCFMRFTGHLPSDIPGNEGHFWGWHTSRHFRLNEACTGRIVDFSPAPPMCWDYGDWEKQPALCPLTPRVHMSFELLTPEPGPACPHADVNMDGIADGFDIAVVRNGANWLKTADVAAEPRADVNGDFLVDGFDIAVIRSGICWLR